MSTYFITGANRGLGLEFVKQLLPQGHTVWATTRDPERSQELLALKAKWPNHLKVIKLDVGDSQSVQGLFLRLEEKEDELEAIDVLINNAGVYSGQADFEHWQEEDFKKCFEINTFGPMRVTHALLTYLNKSDNPKVIHITSKMGSMTDNTSGGHMAYRMSKAALNMFNKSFSIDFSGITSVVLHPGWVQTDMGGPNALITPTESVSGMLKVIEGLSLEDSGGFFDYRGERIPW